MEEEFEEFEEHPQDVMEDGKYVDKWAIRTTAMIAREIGKQNNKAA